MNKKITTIAVASLIALLAGAQAHALTITSVSTDVNLGLGSRGDAVVLLQKFLEAKGLLTMPAGTTEGYYGALTQQAVKKYQQSAQISATGYYGPLTRASVAHDAMVVTSVNIDVPATGANSGTKAMLATNNIMANASSSSDFSTFVSAIKAAGLDELLSGGSYTVFMPTNAAFDKLPAGTLALLLDPANKAKLADILTYHVLSGVYNPGDLYNGQQLKTVDGTALQIGKTGDTISINNSAKVTTPGTISKNGIIYPIDTVLVGVVK